jgi:hypothetical protein
MSSRYQPDAHGVRSFARIVAGLAATAIASLTFAVAASAATDISKPVELTQTDLACLECHAKPTLDRKLGDGKKLALHVSPKAFAASVHGETGCEGCHNDLDEKTHGKVSQPLESRRTLAKSLVGGCIDCHKKTVKLYDDSVHAAMVQHGSDKAPMCTDCHDVHTVRDHKIVENAEAVPCQKCHEGVVSAFNKSIHGEDGEGLVCADCHRTHDVRAASFGDALKKNCLSCHKETVAQHAAWLPNTGRHLEAVTCSACHTPGAERRVSLRLYDGDKQAAEKAGSPHFVRLTSAADKAPSGLDGRELWGLLGEFKANNEGAKLMLRGRLEVKSGEQAHGLAAKAKAVKDCYACHQAGAEPFQSVSVTMAGPDGRPLRHEAKADVLTSIESLGALRGFYALGGTRIELLDWLLLLALAGGIGLAGLHLTALLLTRGGRERRGAAKAAADAKTPNSEP